MLKWADETRRKLNSVDHESSRVTDVSTDGTNSTTTTTTSEESISDDDSALGLTQARTPKATPLVHKHRQRSLDPVKQRRRHSSACQLYAAPEQIVLAWNNNKQEECKNQHKLNRTSLPNTPTDNSHTKLHQKTQTLSLPNTPTDNANTDFLNSLSNNNASPVKNMNQNNPLKISTKPELLQITTKQGDKNHHSFWKHLMGKKSWPSRTYKSPMRKSQSVVETYRKIEESYYMESEQPGAMQHNRDQDKSDYGLSDLVISRDTPNYYNNRNSEVGQSYHSLKTIRRQSDSRRPKLFERRSGGSHGSPDSGFSDIRLSMSMSMMGAFDTERDSGVPRSPTFSSSSSSSDDSACYRKHR